MILAGQLPTRYRFTAFFLLGTMLWLSGAAALAAPRMDLRRQVSAQGGSTQPSAPGARSHRRMRRRNRRQMLTVPALPEAWAHFPPALRVFKRVFADFPIPAAWHSDPPPRPPVGV